MDGALTGGSYEIVLGAVLDEDWSAWFTTAEVTVSASTTTVRGAVVDAPALHGLLGHVRDLAVPLISLRRLDTRAGARDPHRSSGPVDS